MPASLQIFASICHRFPAPRRASRHILRPILHAHTIDSYLQDQATGLIEAFQERTIELFDDADLLADLKALKIKDSGLKIRLVSPEQKGNGDGTAHGDLASALSFAVALARLGNLRVANLNVTRKIITYP